MKSLKLILFGGFLAVFFSASSYVGVREVKSLDARPVIENKTIIASHARKIFVDKDILKNKLALKAKGFVVKDLDTGEDVLKQNSDVKFPIASVTKLVTAMVVLDKFKPDEIIKISKTAVKTYGRQCGLSAGEKFKTADLLNCLLLESSNDAAEAFAEHYGRDNFLTLMNQKAASLGLKDTRYKDPSGLSSSNVSTPEDLALLMAHIESSKEDILEITKRRSYQVAGGVLSKKHTWYNINRLVRDNNSFYTGGKDGFTGEALMTFTGAFTIPVSVIENKRFAIALLRSSDRNSDVKKIVDRVIKSLKYEDGLVASPIFSKKPVTVIEKTLSISFVGDIRMEDNDPAQFESVPYLNDSDITFGTLLGPISDIGYNIGNSNSIRMNPDVVDTLKDIGFQSLSIANEHIGDWGITAIEDTLKRLRSAGIQPIGGGLNKDDATRVRIVEKDGIKIGFLGFSDVGPAWLMKNKDLPTILSAADPDFDKIIKDASVQVDHLVVSIRFAPDSMKERQRSLAERAVDAGARFVIGSSPVLTDIAERYGDGLIVYSLGDIKSGAVLNVILDKKEILEANEDGI